MNLTLVSCSKKSKKDIINTPIYKSYKKLNKINAIDDKIIFTSNKKGLPLVYNQARKIITSNIKNNLYKKEDEYIIFVHDDVYITDIFIKEKLQKAFEKFDIVGVAGSVIINLGLERIGWHLASKEYLSGSVEHVVNNKQEDSPTFWTYFGPTPKKVSVIDGVFIAVKYKSIIDKNVKFDEQFTFDLYDIDFCISAIKSNLEIGTSNIHLTHLSQGEGINENRYIKAENLLRKKYAKQNT